MTINSRPLLLSLLVVGLLFTMGEVGDPSVPPGQLNAAPGGTGIDPRASDRTWPVGNGRFIENRGQWPEPVLYRAAPGRQVIWLEPAAFWVVAGGGSADDACATALRLSFEGAASGPRAVGEMRLPGHYNYLLGNDPEGWATHVPAFRSVLVENLYPGVAVRYREQAQHLEYDLLLEPGADLEQVIVRCDGHDGLSLADGGLLVLTTTSGRLVQRPPPTWELLADGSERPVAAAYRVIDEAHFGFEVPGRDPGLPLVIDPGLEWSTYLGGSDALVSHRDLSSGMALGKDGDIFVTGQTSFLNDFPVTPGVLQETSANLDAFVTRISADGSTLLYSTFLGGVMSDSGHDIEVTEENAAVVLGATQGLGFPVTPGAFDSVFNGSLDFFVSRLSSDGATLHFSTFLGGSSIESATNGNAKIVLAPNRDVLLAARTSSLDYPITPGAYSATGPPGQGVITRLSADGSQLVFSTFLGGNQGASVFGIALFPDERVAVCGNTHSTDFPVTPGAFHTEPDRSFVTVLDPTGSSLLASTYFEGEFQGLTTLSDVAITPRGHVLILGGATLGNGVPTTPGAYLPFSPTSGPDSFLTCFDEHLQRVIFSTFVGGVSGPTTGEVRLDPSGVITVGGMTNFAGYPTTPGAFDAVINDYPFPSNVDLYVSRLAPDGTRLYYSTFLGGEEDAGEIWNGGDIQIALDATGSVVIASSSEALDYPTTPGAFQPANAGGWDAVITKLDMLPTGVRKLGHSTPGTAGPLAIDVTSMPYPGNDGFEITCSNAPASSGGGWLLISTGPLSQPVPLAGADLWIDPTGYVLRLPAESDDVGYCLVPLELSGVAPGTRGTVQFFWRDPGPPARWASSNALEIVVQPPP